MKNIISPKTAGIIMLIIFLLLVKMHLLIMLKLIPSNFVWGGQVGGNPPDLILMETIALIAIVFFAMIVMVKVKFLFPDKLRKLSTIGMWLIFVYFVFNTIGNLLSESTLEKLIFTPVAIILSLLAFRLAIEP